MTNKKDIPIAPINSPEGQCLMKQIDQARTRRDQDVQKKVERILESIRLQGDTALFTYTQKFDHKTIDQETIKITSPQLAAQAKKTPVKLQETIREAARRIHEYHCHQKKDYSFSLTTDEGVLQQLVRPLDRVGVYVPGGHTSYPSTVLMDVIPAQIAGVNEIIVVTPPHDELSSSVAFVLDLLNLKEVYQVGGAQAIGALAYGTESIPAVDKIVGPGNSYVAMAKRLVYGKVDIDSIAGPSEVAILADHSANPNWIALDLLSQAEHGSGDELAICVSESESLIEQIRLELLKEIDNSPVKEVFTRLPDYAITLFVAKDREQSLDLINTLAPEHLQIMTNTYSQDIEKIRNAAAIFIGSYTPVALGDYFIGTNHVLPTGSAARYASPLGVDSFLKRISVAKVDSSGLQKAGSFVSHFAREEKFIHHALSVERRLQ